uniref:Calcium voltage-gated channel auxiliary subunit alpha2delta 4 n=1 Tax=Esox lucius TaxID=8010 RepID=A0A6Q2YRE5_ESOLU
WVLGNHCNYVITKHHFCPQKYKDIESTVKMEEVDGEELVKRFAEEMEGMLGRKMKSVKRLAEAAEDADLYHEFNATLQFDYYNSMTINSVDEEGNPVELGGEFPLEENEHFNKLAVNTQQSDIQVPTNVYNKDPNILNGVYMSEALNDVFLDNFQKDPTLTWQYFGSATGFFRLYPGIAWTPDENGVVTFDCRNRNWYIQAATSPKDIIIVVDISGSMKGLRLTIAKHTINTILDTLGENDFVNVIAYSDYVQYVEPCFKGTLVQADLDNREHFKLLVEELQVKGEGKVKKAMKESFKILNEVCIRSLCNQAIMLITDGAMEDYEDVFQEFNWPERRVRVFTYLIGREVTFAQNVKWIACNNKGYYTHISTLADVQENVMEYLHVLSRPMVINHDHDIIWTEAYMDSSLLLMTTVAMPVFSKKKETLSHGILLGVVGTDVPLKELMRLAPRYKLGVHGYAFLNTNNGYILSHPDLRPLYKEGKKLKPKPNYNSVDLSEVEWEDDDEKVSLEIMTPLHNRCSKCSETVAAFRRRVMFLKNDYFYTTINETPFSLGIVLTRGHGEFIFTGNVSIKEGLNDLMQPDVTIADEWTYCETDIDPHHRKLTQHQAVFRYLTGKEPDLECDEKLLRQTLFDAVVTAPMEAYWTAVIPESPEGVETAFLGTRSGLMRVTRYVGSEKRVAKKFLSPSDKENIFTLDHFPLWYRRAAEYPAGKFLYYIPKEDTRGREDFICAVQLILHKLFVCVCVCLRRVSLYDYQAMCKMGGHSTSSARPLLSVSRNVSTVCVCLLLSAYTTSAQRKKADILQPCDTEYPSFVYEPSIKETNSLIKCGRCQKMFVTQAVPDSNLLILVMLLMLMCVVVLDVCLHNASVKCDRMKSQKVRRRPESCHAYHPHENAKECGGASHIYPSVSLFLTCLTASLACLKASALVCR